MDEDLFGYPHEVDPVWKLSEVRAELKEVRNQFLSTINDILDLKDEHLQLHYNRSQWSSIDENEVIAEIDEDTREVIDYEPLHSKQEIQEKNQNVFEIDAKLRGIEDEISEKEKERRDEERWIDLLEKREKSLIEAVHQGPAQESLIELILGVSKIGLTVSLAVIAGMGSVLLSTKTPSEAVDIATWTLHRAFWASMIFLGSYAPQTIRYCFLRFRKKASIELQQGVGLASLVLILIIAILGIAFLITAIDGASVVISKISEPSPS